MTAGVRDWHECFDIGPELAQQPGVAMHGPNVWPVTGTLRHECTLYYERMNALGRSVMQAIAVSARCGGAVTHAELTVTCQTAIGVEQLLDDQGCTGPNFSLLRLLHYPSRVVPAEGANQHLDIGIGVGAHSGFVVFCGMWAVRCAAHTPATDYGFLTFVRSNAAGLQVQFNDNEWVDAPVEPDVFIVNIGGTYTVFIAS